MARIVFLGTPEFAVPILERVHKAHQVVAVITQPDQAAGRGHKNLVVSPVKLWAANRQLAVYQPARLRR
ncbi:MAG: methionyl-tRNA formyltransferase, partial [Anaerolineae bacterium]